MYFIEPSAGQDWLASLRRKLQKETDPVLALRPTIREALDGSSEILTTVVLRDDVMTLDSAERMRLLSTLEREIQNLVFDGPYSNVGWPLVSFVTETEEKSARRR